MTALVIAEHNKIATPVGIGDIEGKASFSVAIGSDIVGFVNSIATTAVVGRDVLVRSVPPPVPTYFIHGNRYSSVAKWLSVFTEHYRIESVVLLGVVVVVFVSFGQTQAYVLTIRRERGGTHIGAEVATAFVSLGEEVHL